MNSTPERERAMSELLERYGSVVGPEVVGQLRQLSKSLRGLRVVHVNSTRQGGGVAEILHRLIPLKRELGLDAHWEVIQGSARFYQCTKKIHNALQASREQIPQAFLDAYEKTNRDNADRLRDSLQDADIVFIHDPQPAPLLSFLPERRNKWFWRCHIDASRPHRPVWKYLRPFVSGYDASIWSLSEFAQILPHPLYIIPPSIDPLSEKNQDLGVQELEDAYSRWGLDPERPIVSQISRFDRFKDPLGVIRAYKLVRKFVPVQLILAGGDAADDPEGQDVLKEVMVAAENDPDIHVLALPPHAHRAVNALQRVSDILIQKSTQEGFGLTVTEALWKGKPVIGGNAGGIRLQVIDHHTGFQVNSPEGAALRIRYLLKNQERREEMGRKARTFVLENFLITRQLREYLTLMATIVFQVEERIELN